MLVCVCVFTFIHIVRFHAQLKYFSPLAKRVGVRKTKLREWTNWEIKSAVEFLVDCVLLQKNVFLCVFRMMLYLQCLICCTCVCVCVRYKIYKYWFLLYIKVSKQLQLLFQSFGFLRTKKKLSKTRNYSHTKSCSKFIFAMKFWQNMRTVICYI